MINIPLRSPYCPPASLTPPNGGESLLCTLEVTLLERLSPGPLLKEGFGGPLLKEGFGGPLLNEGLGGPLLNEGLGGPLLNDGGD